MELDDSSGRLPARKCYIYGQLVINVLETLQD